MRNEYILMRKRKVYSGYVRCNTCRLHGKNLNIRSGCKQCNQRHFEYGVLYANKFLSYKQLKVRVLKGQKFIDATHNGLNITFKTFGLMNADKK